MTVHDVTRDFLRRKLGPERLAALHGVLVDGAAAGLPAAAPLGPAATSTPEVAWWEPGHDDQHRLLRPYLRDNLIEHLRDAGRPAEAEAVACDLRWAAARLAESGSAALAADLTRAGTRRAARLRAVVERMAHLLAPDEPAGTIADLLYCRVAGDPDWGAQVTALRDLGGQPGLFSRWPLPDVPSPAVRRVLTGRGGGVNAVAIAPDGSWLAAASQDGTTRIWDPATGQERVALASGSAVNAVAVAPDGAWLATGSDDGAAFIWDTATGKQQAALIPLRGPAARIASKVLIARIAVRALTVAPDGTWLATGSSDGTVRTWDAATPPNRNPSTSRPRATLATAGWTTVPALVAVSALIITSALFGIFALIAPIIVLLHPAHQVAHVAHVAPGSHGDFLIRQIAALLAPFYAAYSGLRVAFPLIPGIGVIMASLLMAALFFAILTRHAVNAVAVAPDGSWLAAGSADKTVRIWDPAAMRQRAALTGRDKGMTATAGARDGSWLTAGSRDGTARKWDWDPAAIRQRAALAGRDRGVTAVAVAPDGSWLVTGSRDGTARIWDLATADERAALTGHDGAVSAVATATDGTWLATGSADKTVRIWDLAAGQERAALTGHDGAVNAVAIAPDGTWIASGSNDGTVRIWDPAVAQEQAAVTSAIRTLNAVAVAPDGTWLATGGTDGAVRIRDAVTGEERAVLTGHDAAVNAIAIAPDGTWIAIASSSGTDSDRAASNYGTVQICDPATGQRGAAHTRYKIDMRAVAVAPDGSWLAISSPDRMALTWDPVTGREQAARTGRDIAAGDPRPLIRGFWTPVPQAHHVKAVAVAPDGSWVATAGRDGTARIWDAGTMRQRAALTGHGGQLNAVAVAPDGTWLATGSAGGVVQIWETATWHPWTLMRVDGAVSSCAWAGSGCLAVAGTAGLFMFDFPAGAVSRSAAVPASVSAFPGRTGKASPTRR